MPLRLEPWTIAQAREAGIEDTIALHWEEVDPFQTESPLAVDWDGYRTLECAGVLKLFALFKDDRWIGYINFFVRPPLHHRGTVWAICDLIYVDPEHRRGWAGVFLIKAAELALKDMGVRIIHMAPRARRDPADLGFKRGRDTVGALLQRLDYRLTHEGWMKAI